MEAQMRISPFELGLYFWYAGAALLLVLAVVIDRVWKKRPTTLFVLVPLVVFLLVSLGTCAPPMMLAEYICGNSTTSSKPCF